MKRHEVAAHGDFMPWLVVVSAQDGLLITLDIYDADDFQSALSRYEELERLGIERHDNLRLTARCAASVPCQTSRWNAARLRPTSLDTVERMAKIATMKRLDEPDTS